MFIRCNLVKLQFDADATTVQAASLNFRDLQIVRGEYMFPTSPNVVPASDGAGVVEAVGKKVTRFQAGDKVMVNFIQSFLHSPVAAEMILSAVGGSVDGTLREYGVYNEQGLVTMPSNLTFLEAATLNCAGITAWNSLYGIAGRSVAPGDWVLTQGTGGVSLFALQFAKAAGARVIATTSSAGKADRLKQLGADHVLNYREDASWGETANKITGGKGVQHVIEVTGGPTMRQSLNAIAPEGVISMIGFRGGMAGDDSPGFADAMAKGAITRGVLVGSRQQFEAMIRSVEGNDIKPVVDEKVFNLDQVKEAYQVCPIM